MKFLKYVVVVVVAFVLMLVLGCGNEIDTGKSTKAEMAQTEANQTRLTKIQPAPVLEYSQARRTIVKRLERIGQQNMVSYIYLISYGKIMGHYTVDGYVQAVESYLTTPEQVTSVRIAGGGWEAVTLPSPDFDGTYGRNPDAIYFFTTDGKYVEWKGDYLWCDQPMVLTEKPALIANVTQEVTGHN